MTFRESENVELKREYTDVIRKDLIAFANTDGGTICIGVDDHGEVIGVPSPDFTIQQVSNMARDSIRPDITMFIHYAQEEINGVRIVRITVNRGTGRPYYWAEKGMRPSGVYVRQGNSAAPATDAAIREMIRETDGDAYEDKRSLVQELTFSYAAEVFRKQNLEFGKPQMKTLGLLSEDGMYTNLALMLSDQCPHMIKAAVFSGPDGDNFRDRREFCGSLLKQIDDAYAFLDMRNELSATFEGLYRVDHRAYPEAALREALLNAVVHKDYSFSAATLIGCYSDRVEIVSVGGLVRGLSMSDVLLGLSVCRNPKLANIFYRLELIEAYGTGLNKILKAYTDCSTDKLLRVTENAFRVTLPRRSTVSGEKLVLKESNGDPIHSFLSGSDVITRADVERIAGVSPATASRILRRMVESGELEAVGNGKNTRYIRG